MTTLLNYSSKSLKEIMKELYRGQYIFEEKYCQNICKNIKQVYTPSVIDIRQHWKENIIIYLKCRHKPESRYGLYNDAVLCSNLVLGIQDDITTFVKSRYINTPSQVTKDDLDFIWNAR